jgi:hypothetical protein
MFDVLVWCAPQGALAKEDYLGQALLFDRPDPQQKLVNANKIDQAIGRLKERYPRVARYFDLSYDPQTPIFAAPFNAEKYAKAEKLDGCYLLKTNRTDLSGDELWRIYILLTGAENAFRDMKSPLAERPIFHHTEHCSWFGRVAGGRRYDHGQGG